MSLVHYHDATIPTDNFTRKIRTPDIVKKDREKFHEGLTKVTVIHSLNNPTMFVALNFFLTHEFMKQKTMSKKLIIQ